MVSGVKRDFACTLGQALSACARGPAVTVTLRLEGRTRTLSGPSPDLSPARVSYAIPAVPGRISFQT